MFQCPAQCVTTSNQYVQQWRRRTWENQPANQLLAYCLQVQIFSLSTDNRHCEAGSPSVLYVALFSFSLVRHELVFSAFKFATDAFCNKTHTNLLQQVSPLETQHCSSLPENVLCLCPVMPMHPCLPDRLTTGLNHLYRNKFYLNTSNPIMSEFT